jgi:multidrug transporter EmrE-like cation transporter
VSVTTEDPSLERTAVRRTPVSAANLAILLLAVGLAATGQVALKHGMTQSADKAKAHGATLLMSAVGNIWVVLGLALFGISAVAWLLTLSRVPLAVAYPFNALGYLGILGASVFALGEKANGWTVFGSLMVVSGLIVVVTLSPGTG